jgi:hypothetical protein
MLPELAQWPIERISQVVQPTDARMALDQFNICCELDAAFGHTDQQTLLMIGEADK